MGVMGKEKGESSLEARLDGTKYGMMESLLVCLRDLVDIIETLLEADAATVAHHGHQVLVASHGQGSAYNAINDLLHMRNVLQIKYYCYVSVTAYVHSNGCLCLCYIEMQT